MPVVYLRKDEKYWKETKEEMAQDIARASLAGYLLDYAEELIRTCSLFDPEEIQDTAEICATSYIQSFREGLFSDGRKLEETVVQKDLISKLTEPAREFIRMMLQSPGEVEEALSRVRIMGDNKVSIRTFHPKRIQKYLASMFGARPARIAIRELEGYIKYMS